MAALLPALVLAPALAHASDGSGEDLVSTEQSVDGYTDLEDAQAGAPGTFEERLWLTYGYVPAEGYTPSDTLELSYTGTGALKNSEFDLGQYYEHDDVDESTGFNFGWMQRWVADGGRSSWIPSIGTLAEYYLRTPYLIDQPTWAPGATVGDHLTGELTLAKFAGPGTAYLNLAYTHQFFNSQICVTEEDVAIQPEDAPDKSPNLPNIDGCDYWAPSTFEARVGYKLPLQGDRLSLEVDYTHETNEFTTQTTIPDHEVHHPYEMGNVSISWKPSEAWTLSPGVLFGLDGRAETPAYEAGVFILHE